MAEKFSITLPSYDESGSQRPDLRIKGRSPIIKCRSEPIKNFYLSTSSHLKLNCSHLSRRAIQILSIKIRLIMDTLPPIVS